MEEERLNITMKMHELENFIYHETTPKNAEAIRRDGFKSTDNVGIYFSDEPGSYSGTIGDWGGSVIKAKLKKPKKQIDFDDLEEHPDFELFGDDAFALSKFAHENNIDIITDKSSNIIIVYNLELIDIL